MKTMMRAAGAAAVGLVLGAGGAMADGSVSGTVNVTATVDATCTITGLNSGSFGTADFSNSGSSLILTTTFTSTKPADCNVPTHITVTSNNGAATKITSALASAGGYASYFDYTVTAAFGGSTATLDTSTVNTFGSPESATPATVATPAAGNIVVTVKPDGIAPKLEAGTYTDTVTVTLTAS